MARYMGMVDGKWLWIARKGKTACCDCGLVHDEELRLVKHCGRTIILMKSTRNRRSTAQLRRHMNMKLTRRCGKQ